MVWRETDSQEFPLWEGVVVLKVLERADSQQFLCWEGVVVLTELIFNSLLLLGRLWWF